MAETFPHVRVFFPVSPFALRFPTVDSQPPMNTLPTPSARPGDNAARTKRAALLSHLLGATKTFSTPVESV